MTTARLRAEAVTLRYRELTVARKLGDHSG